MLYISYMDWGTKVLGGRVNPVKRSMWTPSTSVHAWLHPWALCHPPDQPSEENRPLSVFLHSS